MVTKLQALADTVYADSSFVLRINDMSLQFGGPFEIRNESELNKSVNSPQTLPFFDTFENQDPNNPTFWSTFDVELSQESVDPPSPTAAIHLDGFDDAGDELESVPFDLSGVKKVRTYQGGNLNTLFRKTNNSHY
ncbi:hypothetical protein GWO43_20475 [candidate division KSB1 bacterium]|nr:hypothetical protein [candidate division KSB1 bacterium]NIR71873.1 hypothetical protein [candidate division KSB1 bacterium]NIS26440.1 hypothetical protein [candidate division KSB1 bacterium]NIT73210.1 hypothetical protein [candidate division KSB1 bacterium]NIU27124.1 hypothetical protein [candidate division KSB1 bacterium]